MTKSLAPIAASAVLVFSSSVASLAAERPRSFAPGTLLRVRTGQTVELPGVASDEPGARSVPITIEGQPRQLPRPGTSWVGRVQESDAESLTLKIEGEELPLFVPRRGLESIEVGHRRSRRVLKGLGMGAVAGAVGGAFLLGLAEVNCTEFCFGVPAGAAIGAIAFAPVGAAVGGLVGLSQPGWEPVVPRPASPTHHGGRYGLSLRLRF